MVSRRAGLSASAELSSNEHIVSFMFRSVSFVFLILLADRTNGRAYATVLRPCVVVCTECIVAKRCVLEQKLLLTFDSI